MSSLKSFKLGLDSILSTLSGHQANIPHLPGQTSEIQMFNII